MSLPGSFDVSEEGAARYSVPVAVPPGTAGMAPSLSLDYSSRNGNGLVGMGWTLTGLPSIGRCPKIQARDGVRGAVKYDLNDRFCMEGQYLTLVSGTYGAANSEYRTELEGFSRITAKGTAGNGPAWFEVRTKSGQVMAFGNTIDSRILAQGKTTARSWAVNRITDAAGNYLTVTYTNDTTNGQAYPTRIDYTGNAAASLAVYNSVRFVYETRPDIVPLYHAGSLQKNTVRLSNIRTYEGDNVVADYRLAYDTSPATSRSRLTSVKLCAGIAGAAPCLPETIFAWQGNSTVLPGILKSLPAWAGYNLIPGDFNGDGRTDLLLQAKASSGLSYVYIADGEGNLTQTGSAISGWDETAAVRIRVGNWLVGSKDSLLVAMDTNNPSVLVLNAKIHEWVDDEFVEQGSGVSGILLFYADQSFMLNGDVNGDGIDDLVSYYQIGTMGGSPQIHFGDGSGNFSPYGSLLDPMLPWGTAFSLVLGDWTGIGSAGLGFISHFNTPSLFYQWNGSGIVQVSSAGVTGYGMSAVVGDWNGDGITDLLRVTPGSAQAGPMYLNRGDGTFVATGYNPSWGAYDIHTGDWNGDGKTDIGLISKSTSTPSRFFVASATGSSFEALSFAPSDWTNSKLILGDWNGTGITSILRIPSSGSAVSHYLSSYSPDLLVSITSGSGSETGVTYRPLTDDGVYEKGSDGVYPVVDIQGSLYVVSEVETDDGIGGTYASEYAYKGAKVDLDGRGFLGFREWIVTDPQTDVVQVTEYLQSFPYIGLIDKQTKKRGAQTLNELTNTWTSVSHDGGLRRRVLLEQTVEASWDLDGSAIPPVTTSYIYDGYSNPTQVVVSTPDGASKVTVNTYTNDTANWRFGRLTRSEVTSTVP